MHGDKRSRGVLVAIAAAAGAFGAAAMMSAATAPTARADDFSDIIANVESEFGIGQTAFTTAAADFGSNEVPAGLQYSFDGVLDDSVGAPDQVFFGTVAALAGDSISNATVFNFGIGPPTDFADAVTSAQSLVISAETEFTDAATFLSGGEYFDAAFAGALASADLDIAPEYLFVGAVEALGF